MNNAPYGGLAEKLLPAALVIACLLILFWAVLRANAAWHFIAAQSIAAPLFEKSVGEVVVFEASQAHINVAMQRFPGNPDYLDFAGRLSILKASQPGVMGVEHRTLLESAADNFRRALTVRPLWPYSWVNLLTAKDKLGQVDTEFNMALNRAAELGPWEPRVQLQVIRSGLHNWSKLGNTDRQVVQQKLLDALRVQPGNAFQIVRAYGRPDLVCNLEGTHAQIRNWCAEVVEQRQG